MDGGGRPWSSWVRGWHDAHAANLGLGERAGVQVCRVTPLADSVASSGVADTVARGRSTLALHRGPGPGRAANRQQVGRGFEDTTVTTLQPLDASAALITFGLDNVRASPMSGKFWSTTFI